MTLSHSIGLTCRSGLAGRSDTQQSPSGADLATLEDLRQVCFGQGRVELALRRKGHGQVSIKIHVLFYVIRPCNGLDTIVSNGRKKTMFRLLLDTAVKTVAYRWQVIQIVETLVHSPDPASSPSKRASSSIWSLPFHPSKRRTHE